MVALQWTVGELCKRKGTQPKRQTAKTGIENLSSVSQVEPYLSVVSWETSMFTRNCAHKSGDQDNHGRLNHLLSRLPVTVRAAPGIG